MPRISGVSFSETLEWSRRRPSPFATVRWLCLNPVGLVTSVTVTVPPGVESVRWFAMMKFLRAHALEIREFLAPEPRKHRRILQLAEARHRRTHDVMGIGGSERLGHDVRDAAGLDDRAHGAAGDDAGAVRRRLQQHGARAELADDAVRNRVARDRHAHQILLR